MDLALPEHYSLSQRVFRVVEKAILTGTIKPGERIIETDLAKRLGTSKSPVREALRRLEGEGVVELLPRKGYVVKGIDRKRVDDFFDIMLIVEPATVKMSLRKKQDDVCKEFDQFIAKMERQLKKKDYESYLVSNDEFHMYFYRLADNEWATKFSQMLRKQADMLRSLSLFTRNRFTPSIVEHKAIVEAYRKSDESGLATAVENHLMRFKDNILKSELLKGNP